MLSNLRKTLTLIASTPSHALPPTPNNTLLLPLLSLASSLYGLGLSARRELYRLGVFRQRRLGVPVVSVGNLTWGGNGKTPMVEFLVRVFEDVGVSPLVLTRGYAGGDEAKMLSTHLRNSLARIGVGANRAKTAACFFEKYGCMDMHGLLTDSLSSSYKSGKGSTKGIGLVILDDGMQHRSLSRELDIVMVNGMMAWGNNHLLPRGPLREPLGALERADVAVIHHADLVPNGQLNSIEKDIQRVKEIVPVYFSRMAPSHFFNIKNPLSKLSLTTVRGKVVLCVSGIGFPSAFVQVIEKIGPSFVDRLDFSDHHHIQAKDIKVIKEKINGLHLAFKTKPVIVLTEKDYHRDPVILKDFKTFSEVLVLCSSLKIIPLKGRTEESFKSFVKELLRAKWRDER